MFDDRREPNSLINPNDGHRRGSAERVFPPSNENASFQDVPSPLENGGGYSANKGSRFAKFFDGKGRENAVPFSKPLTPVSFGTSSPGPQRQENGNYIGSHGGPADHRAMDDIYAMLSSSAQVTCIIKSTIEFNFTYYTAEPPGSSYEPSKYRISRSRLVWPTISEQCTSPAPTASDTPAPTTSTSATNAPWPS